MKKFAKFGKLGAVDSGVDVRDYRIKHSAVAKITKESEFPQSFALALGPVKNQGSVGSCVAASISQVVEYHNDINTEMSIGYIYGNRRETFHKSEGLITRDALKTTCIYGDATQKNFPYNVEVPTITKQFEKQVDGLFDEASKLHFEKYLALKNEDEVKYYLMNNGPVVFAMHWYSDITVGKDGIIKSTYASENDRGGHCMVIYGWNKDGWMIRNSWGKLWGQDGNAILPYNAPIRELWGVVDDKNNTPIVKPYHTKIGRLLAKIFNFFANLWLKIFK